jgi:hypothetical protein
LNAAISGFDPKQTLKRWVWLPERIKLSFLRVREILSPTGLLQSETARQQRMADLEPYSKWLGIDPECIPPNYYQLLGVSEESCTPEGVRKAATAATTKVRAIRPGQHAVVWTRVLDEIERARKTLSDNRLKSEYDRTLTSVGSKPGSFKRRLSESANEAPRKIQKPDALNLSGKAAKTLDTAKTFKTAKTPATAKTSDTANTTDMLPPKKRSDGSKIPRGVPEITHSTVGAPGRELKMAIPLPVADDSAQESLPEPVPPTFTAVPVPPEAELKSANEAIAITAYKRSRGGKGLLIAMTVTMVALLAGGGWWVIGIVRQNDLTSNASPDSIEANASTGGPADTQQSTKNERESGTNTDGADVQNNGPVESAISETIGDNKPRQEANGNGDLVAEHESITSDDLSGGNGESGGSNNGVNGIDMPDSEIPKVTDANRAELMMLFRRVRKALARREIHTAQSLLEQAKSIPASQEHTDMFERLGEAVQLSEKFWTLVSDYQAKLRGGESFKVGDTEVAIVETGPNFLAIREAGKNRKFYLEDLPSQFAVAIVESAESGNPDWNVVKAVYYWTQAEYQPDLIQRAEQFLNEAKGKTETGKCEKLLLDQYDADRDGDVGLVPDSQTQQKVMEQLLKELGIDSVDQLQGEMASTMSSHLLSQSFEENDDDIRFTQLELAKQCALQADDFFLALDIIDELYHHFEIDEVKELEAAIGQFAPLIKSDHVARKFLMHVYNLAIKLKTTHPDFARSILPACEQLATRRQLDSWTVQLETLK